MNSSVGCNCYLERVHDLKINESVVQHEQVDMGFLLHKSSLKIIIIYQQVITWYNLFQHGILTISEINYQKEPKSSKFLKFELSFIFFSVNSMLKKIIPSDDLLINNNNFQATFWQIHSICHDRMVVGNYLYNQCPSTLML
jgi:hypothetical protein